MNFYIEVLSPRIHRSKQLFFRTVLIVLLLAATAISRAAVINFTTVWQATGTSFTLQQNSVTLESGVLSGYNFLFTDNQTPNLFSTGNNISGTFKYYNNSGVLVSVDGTLSRQFKNGNVVNGFYFVSQDFTKAFMFVVPGKDAAYSGSQSVNTSSDFTGADLNTVVLNNPQITVSASSLNAFTTCSGTSSSAQNFTVSGVKLTANITVTAPTGFEVSLSSGSGYASSVSIAYGTGTVSSTTVYVRVATTASTGNSSGYVTVTSTNANTGKVSVSSLVNNLPLKFGNALNFDGADDYVSIGKPLASALSYTIEAWVKLDADASTTTPKNIVSSYSTPLFISGLQLKAGIGGTYNIVQDPGNFPLNVWKHVAVSYNGSTKVMTLYVDGVQVSQATSNVTPSFSGEQFRIGSHLDETASTAPVSLMNGSIDEVRIWSRVRTQAEIRSSMNIELAGTESGLVDYYNFNQGIAGGTNSGLTSLTDKTSSANNGTLNGFALSTSSSNWVSGLSGTIASISGTTSVCEGSSTTLSNTTFGGVWSSSNTAVATVDANGVVSGIAAGTTTISYTLTSGDGCTSSVTTTFTVTKAPGISSVTPASRCGEGTLTLTAAAATGTINWYAAETGGSPLATGTTYTTPNLSSTATYYVGVTSGSCVSPRMSVTATINPTPTISGTNQVCIGGTTTLTGSGTPAANNAWVSDNTSVATISNTGTVSGITAGMATITYATQQGCSIKDTVWVNSQPMKFGNALNFDGANDYVDLGTILPAGNYTKEAWIYITDAAATNNIISGDQATAQHAFYVPPVTGGSKLSAGHNGSWAQVQDPNTINVNTWYHVAVSYDAASTTLTLYKNGVQVAQNTAVGAISSNSKQTYIGAYIDLLSAKNAFKGNIDEVRIWNTVRTQAQIQANMNVELAGNESGLVNYYNFNQGIAGGTNTLLSSLIDKTSSANNGTLNGFALTGTTSNWVSGQSGTIAAITGTASVCEGATTTLSNASPGGVWSSSNTAVATVNANGVVTGVAGGTVTIRYTITNATGCAAEATVSFTVNAAPAITNVGNAATCGTGTLALSATATNGTINWYAASTGGSSLATGTSFVTPSISSTTTYYVAATGTNGCVSSARTPVTATINSAPAAPVFTTSTKNVTQGQTGVVYTVSNQVGITYSWGYTTDGGATIKGTGNSVTVDYSNSATSGTLTVIASNGSCSASTPLQITMGQKLIFSGSTTTPCIVKNTATVVDAEIQVNSTSTLTDAKVQVISNFENGDVLAYTGTLPTGVTSSWDGNKGILTFTGSATAAAWQALLRTVTLQTASGAAGVASTKQISLTMGGGILNPTNGHYYEYVSDRVDWSVAKAAAEAKTYYGLKGYLVTITSQAENDFIKSKIGSDSWIGASDDYRWINRAIGTKVYEGQNDVDKMITNTGATLTRTNSSYSEGYWYWVTGPEAGTQFSQNNAGASGYVPTGRVSNPPTSTNNMFSNWSSGEPNNYGAVQEIGDFRSSLSYDGTGFSYIDNNPATVNLGPNGWEHYGEIYIASGKWNDFPNTNKVAYIVEYGGMVNDAMPVLTFTKDVNVYGGGTIGNVTVCTGTANTTLTLSGQIGTVVKWQSAADAAFTSSVTDIANTATTYTVNNPTTTKYYRAVLSSTACGNTYYSTIATLTVNTSPSFSVQPAATAQTLCVGTTASSYSVTASAGSGTITSYKWYNGSNTLVATTNTAALTNSYTPVTTSASSTNYYVVVTNSNNCTATSTSTGTVTVNALPTITGGNTEICVAGIKQLTGSATAATSNAWVSGTSAVASVSNTGLVTALSAGTSTITYTNSNGCKTTTSITISATSVGGNITGGTTVCAGTNSTTLTLSGYTGNITRWESATDAAFTTPSTIANTSATYTATNLTGTRYYRAIVTSGVCSAAISGSATITVNPAPVGGTISGAAAVCAGTNSTTLTLSGYTGNIVKWQSSTSSNFSNPVDIAHTGTSYTASNLNTSTYYRAVISNGVCNTVNSGTALVTVNNQPAVSITQGTSLILGASGSTQLNASASGGSGSSYSYQWSNASGTISGATNNPYSITAVGTYSVKVTDGNGCSASSAPISISTLPDINTGGSNNFCSGGNVVFSFDAAGVNGTNTWQVSNDNTNWSDITSGVTTTGTVQSYSAIAGGYYRIKNDNAGVLAYTAVQQVTVYNNPSVSVSSNPSSVNNLCAGSSVEFTASASGGTGYNYQWFTNNNAISSATNTTYTTTVSGQYQVKVTDDKGCTATANTATVQLNALPVVTLNAPVFCNGSSGTLTASPDKTGNTYTWTVPAGVTDPGNVASFTVNTAGTYSVTVSDGTCSSNSTSTVVTVNALPVLSSITGEGSTYIGNTSQFSNSTPGGVWSSSNPSIASVNPSGLVLANDAGSATISYSVTDNNACVATTTKLFQVATPTIVMTGTFNAFNSCSGIVSTEQSFTVSGSNLDEDLVVTAPAGYEISLTSGGSFSGAITLPRSNGTVATTAIYIRLTNTASNGASGQITGTSHGAATQNLPTGTAVVNNPPTIGWITGTKLLCSGNSTSLTAVSAANGAVYKWYDAATSGNLLYTGATYNTVALTTGTTYYVSVTDANGCEASSRTAAQVIVSDLPSISYATLQTYIQNTAITSLLPVNTGSAIPNNLYGTIRTIAGTGVYANTGNGGPATSAELQLPVFMALDASENLYFGDFDSRTIRKIDKATGIISTIAGGGGAYPENVSAVSAQIGGVQGVSIDGAGNLYLADYHNARIRKINTAGIISTIAGGGGSLGDNGSATSAKLINPYGVAVDAFGNVYVADAGQYRVRKISTSGIITTFAGTGTEGYSGDGGAANAAKLKLPMGVAVDASGNVYVTDYNGHSIRKINTAGVISTIAGTGQAGYNGDGIAATTAQLRTPMGIWVDASGNIYVVDKGNNRIRKINTSGIISTVAGTGNPEYNNDGIAATASGLKYPSGVILDASGNMYISDTENRRIRKIDNTGYRISPALPDGLRIDGTGTISGTPTVTSPATNYTVTATSASGCSVSTTVNIAVINRSITITGSLTPFTSCAGSASAEQSFTLSGTSLSGDITITAPAGYELALVSGGTYSGTLTVTPTGGLVNNTKVYVRLKANATNGAGGNISFASTGITTQNLSTGTATVTEVPTIINVSDGAVCGSGSIVLGAMASAGTVSWYTDAVGGTAFGTGNSYSTAVLTSTTVYYVDATNAGCTTTNRTRVTATVNPLPGMTLGHIANTGTMANSFNIPYTATSNNPDQYSVIAGSPAMAGFTSVINAALTGSPLVIPMPANTVPGTYGFSLIVKNSVTGCSSTQIISFDVSSLNAGSIGADQTICSGQTPSVLRNLDTARGGMAGPHTYQWQSSIIGLNSGFTDIDGATDLDYQPGALTRTTYFQRVAYDGNRSQHISTTPITILVNTVPEITTGVVTGVKTGASGFDLPYTITRGTADHYSITAATPAMSGFATVTNAILGSNPVRVSIPSSVPAGRYGFTITVSSGTSGCASLPVSFEVSVANAASTIEVSGNTIYNYNGKEQGPSTANVTGSKGTVTYSYVGTNGTVYGPSSKPPTEPGSYSVVATVEADADYDGATSAPYSFKIVKGPTTIEVTGLTEYAYNGIPQGPSTASVTGSTGAIQYSYVGTNGTVYGPSNKPPTEPGTYALIATVEADANYDGATSAPYSFKIVKGPSKIVATGLQEYVYNGRTQGPATSVVTGSTGSVTYSYQGADGTVYGPTDKLPVNPGTYLLTATVAEDSYYSGAVSSPYAFVILKAPSVIVVSGPVTYIQNGSPQGPSTSTVTGSNGAVTYSYVGTGGTIYGPSSTPPSNAGSYTVVARVQGNSQYNEATSLPYAFTIVPAVTLLDIKMVLDTVQLQSDGTFLTKFNLLATNQTPVRLDSVQIKDDLSAVLPVSSNFRVVSLTTTGALKPNPFYNGSSVIDMLQPGSTIAPLGKDSVNLSVLLSGSTPTGNYNNIVQMIGTTMYGTAQILSNDTVRNPNNTALRMPTVFYIPKLDIIIPGGFSPNRDGANDYFVITRPYNTRISLQVLNRWGLTVYKNEKYENDWDGRETATGQPLQLGTYYYIVIATDMNGTIRKFQGPVTLVR